MAGKAGAKQRWELENDVQDIQSDAYYKHDAAEQQALLQQKPWTKDPHYFKNVRISALALLKMAMHAKSGGNLEIMGMLYGKVQGDTFIVIDAFALPVEGTETRVNAQAEAYEYMVDFAETNKAVGRLENMVGWYHSHPGYGCWLSGIDVSTQSIQQQYQEPFLAIVVDPHRTIAAGKVEIGAFRTYPEHYKPPDEKPSEYQTIPLSKIEDFGVHANSYYSLDISYFKSSLDAGLLDHLWGKYWVNTLASSPLLATRDLTAGQMRDIADKLEACEGQLTQGGRIGRFVSSGAKKDGGEQQLHKICCDANKLALEHIKGVSGQIVKDLLFNHAITSGGGPSKASGSAVLGEVAPMEP
ncbi:proteasome regulatory particle subunit RPN11 [Coccomyxa viridis]|uniref:Proteasome regulatory particle subunit RPN11 n=1 Tax=Coccomyxa viridis TaxID=1274662 RepID=A0AAV1I8L9_9CHLO|nr:proteasome regulatory particle subunit RPN11 [Coccomyxa viridis]